MKSLIFLLTSCLSIFATAGFGGIGGGSSSNSISTNQLAQLLNSNTYSVRVPQIAFSNSNNSTTYVGVDKICHSENSLLSMQDVVLVNSIRDTEGAPNIVTEKLQRSLLSESAGVMISLDHRIEIYKGSSVHSTYDNMPIYLGTKIYTIPNCK